MPWYGAEGAAVRQWVQAGRALAPDACVPPPCYEVVRAGLAFRERERCGSLPDIRYVLRKALQVTGPWGDPPPCSACQDLTDLSIPFPEGHRAAGRPTVPVSQEAVRMGRRGLDPPGVPPCSPCR